MIVAGVQQILQKFNSHMFLKKLPSKTKQGDLMPGLQQNEGCSIHGGCTTYPFMKMNSLDSLMEVCELMNSGNEKLHKYIIIKNK